MASSSRAGGRSRTEGWSWWDEVNFDPPTHSGGARPWTCKLCPYKRVGGANRVRAHLLHEPGHEVKFCERVTPEIRKELLAKLAAHQALSASQRVRAVDPNTYVTPTQTSGSTSGGGASSSTPSSRPPRGTTRGFTQTAFPMPQPTAPSLSRRQSTLEGSWDPKKKEEVDAAVARFFFHDHIAFRVARYVFHTHDNYHYN